MKISSAESTKSVATGTQSRILPEGDVKSILHPAVKHAPTSNPLQQGIESATAALQDVPDIREDIVSDLKARISAGEYVVSGEEVADMLLRRLKADKTR